MDEMDLLVSEANSLGQNAIAYAERASLAESVDDAKDIMRKAIRATEDMRDRLEEALDFAEIELDQVSIEDALIHVDDAIDEGILALQEGDVSGHIAEMRYEVREGMAHLESLTTVEV